MIIKALGNILIKEIQGKYDKIIITRRHKWFVVFGNIVWFALWTLQGRNFRIKI